MEAHERKCQSSVSAAKKIELVKKTNIKRKKRRKHATRGSYKCSLCPTILNTPSLYRQHLAVSHYSEELIGRKYVILPGFESSMWSCRFCEYGALSKGPVLGHLACRHNLLKEVVPAEVFQSIPLPYSRAGTIPGHNVSIEQEAVKSLFSTDRVSPPTVRTSAGALLKTEVPSEGPIPNFRDMFEDDDADEEEEEDYDQREQVIENLGNMASMSPLLVATSPKDNERSG